MLPGGGARAAYQVGALRAIWELLDQQHNPFPIITGTSAGAINAAVLASHADQFAHGLQRLEYFWGRMRCSHIYRTEIRAAVSSGLRWLTALTLGGLLPVNPRSLLDNHPLRQLLAREFQAARLPEVIASGALRGLAVTASGYTCAMATTFFQAEPGITPWRRARRRGLPTQITKEHLLASAALPLLFPSQAIGFEHFGDGGMRQTAPLSPAIHLGATRILVITTRDERLDPEPTQTQAPPAFGDIAGHLLDAIFLDNLQADLARLHRINHTLTLVEQARQQQTGLRPIDTLLLRPSRDVREIARRHAHRMPGSVRYLLRGVGAWGGGMQMPSYLLFEAAFCQELMQLGYADARDQADSIRRFMDAADPSPPVATE